MRVLSGHFIGGHPLAGWERSGPEAARADLFEGRPWVLTPGPSVPSSRLEVVVGLVRAVGALPVLQHPTDHDAAVAVVSHVPQAVASLLAARLLDASDAALDLVGSGARDTTRIAASDPQLWTQILEANAGPVLEVLDRLGLDLDLLRDSLRTIDSVQRAEQTYREADTSIKRPTDESLLEALAQLRALLDAGRAGRRRIPGKHGGRAVAYAVVPVVVPDEPGSLARLFAAAGEAGVNIEDVSIEHSPGQPVGLIELSVAPGRVSALAAALQSLGWRVH